MKTYNFSPHIRMNAEPRMIMKRVMFLQPVLATVASAQSMLSRVLSAVASILVRIKLGI